MNFKPYMVEMTHQADMECYCGSILMLSLDYHILMQGPICREWAAEPWLGDTPEGETVRNYMDTLNL